MPSTTNDLQFFNLSHRWGHGMPQWPSRANLNVRMVEFHAKDGVRVNRSRHHAPRHAHGCADPCGGERPDLTDYPLWRYLRHRRGGVDPQGQVGRVTPEDLEKATPKIRTGDIVMINTGSHHEYGDSPDYFCYGPGLYKSGAQWLVDKRR